MLNEEDGPMCCHVKKTSGDVRLALSGKLPAP